MTRVARTPGDFYPTPAPVVAAHVQRVLPPYPASGVRRILEPSAGTGAYVRELRKRDPIAQIIAVEPDPTRAALCRAAGAEYVACGTFEEFAAPSLTGPIDLVIGNPPYSHALEHVRLGLDLLAPGGCLSFLLRLGFASSKGRRALFERTPPTFVDVLATRPSFSWTWTCGACGDKWARPPDVCPGPCPTCETIPNETPTQGHTRRGTCTRTDAHDYAIFTWHKGFQGMSTLRWMA